MHDVSILHLIVKMVSSRRMKLLQLPVQCECVFWCRGCVSLSKHKLTSWRRLFRWILVWSKGAIITKQRKSLKNIEYVFGYYWAGDTPVLLAQLITSHPLLLFINFFETDAPHPTSGIIPCLLCREQANVCSTFSSSLKATPQLQDLWFLSLEVSQHQNELKCETLTLAVPRNYTF